MMMMLDGSCTDDTSIPKAQGGATGGGPDILFRAVINRRACAQHVVRDLSRREPQRTHTVPMRVQQLQRISSNQPHVGGWDWEQHVAHQRGKTELTQDELMTYLRNESRVAEEERDASRDAESHARRLVVLVENFFSEEECDALVRRVEDERLLTATKSASLQNLLANCNFEQDTPQATALAHSVAQRLWERLLMLGTSSDDNCQAVLDELRVAPEWASRDYHVRHASSGEAIEMRLVAMSDYIRMMKYSAEPTASATDQHTGDFGTDPRTAHFDGRNKRPEGDSFLTALLYLSGDGEDDGSLRGGATVFMDENGEPVMRVVPKKGALLLFDHHLYHRGERVTEGVKYVLRSDLLYAPSVVCERSEG